MGGASRRIPEAQATRSRGHLCGIGQAAEKARPQDRNGSLDHEQASAGNIPGHVFSCLPGGTRIGWCGTGGNLGMGRSAVLAVIASVIAAYALGVVSVQHPEKNRSPNPDSSQSADAKRNYPSRSPGTARSPQSVSQVHRTESAQKGDQQHWSEKFIDHLPDWFVALFTAVLSLFTYRLYQATVGLQEATAGLLERAAEQ